MSLLSASFAPDDKSTPLLDHTNGTTTSQKSDVFIATEESNSGVDFDTIDSTAVVSNDSIRTTQTIKPPKKKVDLTKPFTFDMIESGDSTDEEDDVLSKPHKRPPPPAWSLLDNRTETITRQAEISTKIIDKLFGMPTEVDLLEIFPNIKRKLLTRRESSFVWNTPTRHSVSPQY